MPPLSFSSFDSHSLHNHLGLVVGLVDALVGKDLDAVAVYLILDGHILAEHSVVDDAAPRADSALPADNGGVDVGALANGGTIKDGGVDEARGGANDAVGANGHVGAEDGAGGDLRGGVDEDVANDDEASLSRGLGGEEGAGGVGGKRIELLRKAGDVIVGLANVHPEAGELHAVQLLVRSDRGEHLRLDGGLGEGDAVKDRLGEDINTSVDLVADKSLGLLDEALNLAILLVVDNDAILGGVLDLGGQDGALAAVRVVEREELLQGEAAGNVGVEDEEGLVVLHKLVAGEREGAGGAEGLRLVGEDEGHAELLRPDVHLLTHEVGAVSDGEDDVGDASLLQRNDLMDDHWLVAEGDEGLGGREGEGAEAGAEATDEDEGAHTFGGRHDVLLLEEVLGFEI